MRIRIAFCEVCDDWRLPEEFIKWRGECALCRRGQIGKNKTARIALFDDGVKELLSSKYR